MTDKNYLNIQNFCNYLYSMYSIQTRKKGNTVYIMYAENYSNSFRRTIGEEISDFLKNKDNQHITFYPHLPSFDSWRYDNNDNRISEEIKPYTLKEFKDYMNK